MVVHIVVHIRDNAVNATLARISQDRKLGESVTVDALASEFRARDIMPCPFHMEEVNDDCLIRTPNGDKIYYRVLYGTIDLTKPLYLKTGQESDLCDLVLVQE